MTDMNISHMGHVVFVGVLPTGTRIEKCNSKDEKAAHKDGAKGYVQHVMITPGEQPFYGVVWDDTPTQIIHTKAERIRPTARLKSDPPYDITPLLATELPK